MFVDDDDVARKIRGVERSDLRDDPRDDLRPFGIGEPHEHDPGVRSERVTQDASETHVACDDGSGVGPGERDDVVINVATEATSRTSTASMPAVTSACASEQAVRHDQKARTVSPSSRCAA